MPAAVGVPELGLSMLESWSSPMSAGRGRSNVRGQCCVDEHLVAVHTDLAGQSSMSPAPTRHSP